MKVGFTGTRNGMTKAQSEAFARLIVELNPEEFHHGDCVGADNEAANMVHTAMADKCRIIRHPPNEDRLRAFNPHYFADCDPKPYLERNWDIVNESDILIACPKEACWQPKGGTWHTVDYAMMPGKKPVRIIYPGGEVRGM